MGDWDLRNYGKAWRTGNMGQRHTAGGYVSLLHGTPDISASFEAIPSLGACKELSRGSITPQA